MGQCLCRGCCTLGKSRERARKDNFPTRLRKGQAVTQELTQYRCGVEQAEHERQTLTELSTILGNDTSLLDGAIRLKARAENAEWSSAYKSGLAEVLYAIVSDFFTAYHT